MSKAHRASTTVLESVLVSSSSFILSLHPLHPSPHPAHPRPSTLSSRLSSPHPAHLLPNFSSSVTLEASCCGGVRWSGTCILNSVAQSSGHCNCAHTMAAAMEGDVSYLGLTALITVILSTLLLPVFSLLLLSFQPFSYTSTILLVFPSSSSSMWILSCFFPYGSSGSCVLLI
jgi:hypothetical protein